MPKQWDDNIKRLIRANPQHYVTRVLKGAIYKDALSIELKNVTREADFLLDVEYEGDSLLLLIEAQSYKDENMALRLPEYLILAIREHGRPILPVLIYLRKDLKVPESPLILQAPVGHEVLRFHFIVLKLWAMKAEELIEAGLLGLLPLVPLTADGREYEVIDRIVTELAEASEYDLLEYTRRFASLVFQDAANLEWLNRRFNMYKDILEDSWVGQEERREGAVRGLHQTVIKLVKAHFPEIVELAKKQIDGIQNPEVLQDLILKISFAQNVQEAVQLLFAVDQRIGGADIDNDEPTVSD
ncbi:MAG TPA: Rpn family recombination-promoting nuclease/putative transposase [Ktedonobacteraceae bacterium]|nr:Rpn family recombination-promoting nuclease/putative transposase [Ktedonobacteraceae bacterium]